MDSTDWALYFVPALQGPLWAHPGFFSPPWAVPLLWLLAQLPPFIVLVMSICAVCFVAVRKLRPWGIFVFLTCPATIYGIGLMNIDWIVLLGVCLSPGLAAYCFSLKPHIGWLAILRDRRGWALLAVVVLCSALWWGVWLVSLGEAVQQPEQSLFPWSLLALPFVWSESLAAGLLFSPHLSYSSYMLLAFGLARRCPWLLFVVNLCLYAAIVAK